MDEIDITATLLPKLRILEARALQNPEAFEARIAFIDPLVADANRRAIPPEAHPQLFMLLFDALREAFPDAETRDLAYALRTAISRRERKN
jgi:hypothetical protein